MSKITELSTPVLLGYSSVLENIMSTNLQLQREFSDAVTGGFATVEELNDLHNKSISANIEADRVYSEVQKELDLRLKRDLSMQYGIRFTHSIMKQLDQFVKDKNREHEQQTALKESQEGSISNQENYDQAQTHTD